MKLSNHIDGVSLGREDDGVHIRLKSEAYDDGSVTVVFEPGVVPPGLAACGTPVRITTDGNKLVFAYREVTNPCQVPDDLKAWLDEDL